MYPIAKASLDLLGAFTFLAALLFNLSVIGVVTVGGTGFDALVYLLGAIVLVMALAEIALMVVDNVSPSAGETVAAIGSVACSLVSFGLFLGTATLDQNGEIAVSISVILLSVAAICQLHCFARLNNLDGCSAFLASAISLTAAFLLLYIAFSVLSTPLSGLVFLAFVMVVTGSLACVNLFSAKRETKEDGESRSTNVHLFARSADASHEMTDEDDSNVQQRKRDILVLALPLVIVSLFCTFALGQSQKERLFSIFDAHPAALLLILFVFVAITICLYRIWKRSMSIDAYIIGLVVPLTLPILVTVFEHLVPSLSIASFLMLTQIFYLLYSWTSILLIGRSIAVGNSLIPGFIVLFLLLYTAFMYLPEFEGAAIASRIITLASLFVLICLLLYYGHKANQTIVVAQEESPEMGIALQKKCEEAAKAFNLSPRESELLPMLAIGLSASTIGKRMILSDHTIKTHRYRIYQKFGISSHEELVEKLDLISPFSEP